MTFEIFLGLMLIVSMITGWVTEGIKILLRERNKTYHANALAGGVAVSISIFVWGCYIIIVEASFNAKMVVYLIALILLSWLASMLGYDKIVQGITQFKKK